MALKLHCSLHCCAQECWQDHIVLRRKRRTSMKVMLGALLGLMLAGVASADTVWTYAGNIMDGSIPAQPSVPSCNCALTGSVTLDANNQATAWDFTDGTHELTQADSTGSFNTSVFGPTAPLFSTWTVNIMSSTWLLHTQFYGSATEATDSSFGMTQSGLALFGYLQGNHGIWTESVAATEPATALLVGLGLAAVGLMRRRKKPRLDTSDWENLG
jgi:hypothetical protein